MTTFISAIILAAGESKRMGRPKQLMPLGEATVLERTVDSFLGSKVSEVLVVLGHRAEDVAKLMATRPVTITVNADYRAGMSTSIVAGLSLVQDRSEGVILALGDQPFVDSRTINQLIEAFATHTKRIVVPVYQGRRGHPIIFGKEYRRELLKLKGDIGGRDIISEHPDAVLEVGVRCKGVLIDVDTPDFWHYSTVVGKTRNNRR